MYVIHPLYIHAAISHKKTYMYHNSGFVNFMHTRLGKRLGDEKHRMKKRQIHIPINKLRLKSIDYYLVYNNKKNTAGALFVYI